MEKFIESLSKVLLKDGREFATLYYEEEGSYGEFTILDGEIDPIAGTCSYDDSVELDVSKYSYIKLTTENLFTLLDMIEEHRIATENFEEKWED